MPARPDGMMNHVGGARLVADTAVAVDSALHRLIAAEQAPLFRIALAVCGDRHLAEEALAEAFARSWPALRAGSVDNPHAYLRRAVLNVLQGRFRRLAVERRARDRRDADGRGELDTASGVADRDVVLTALRRLPERQRAVVVLRYYEGLSEAEIAAELRIPAGTVKSTTARASARLRELLEEDRHD